MKYQFKIPMVFIAIISLSLSVIAQPKMKLGKVSMDDLKMTVYAADSAAEAVILGENSYINITYTSTGFKLVKEVHRRIKILHEDAIDEWGNISFSLLNINGKRERLFNFKAYTINLENGKASQEKIGLKDAFSERASEKVVKYKFTFKNIQVGSIIDYSYKLYSDFYTRVPDLYFQRSIPVVWSEKTFEYPDYFQYKYFMTGSERVYKNETKSVTENTENFTIQKTRDYWVLKDIPALKQLSFMRPVNNYLTKINYELYGIAFPGSVYENYSTSWEEINKDLLEADYFGHLLKRLGPTKDIAEGLGLNEASDLEKINAAVHHVKSNFLFNDNFGVYLSLEWRKNLKEQKGSAPELNFTLIGILKNLGIKAHPVILSTRANGTIFKNFPATEDFNYVITAIEYEGKYILVDPTSEFTGLNILPEYCLNGEGLLISEAGPKWVSLETGVPYDISEFVQFKLDEDLTITADYQAKFAEYAAYYLRDNISESGGEEKYITDFIEKNKVSNISNYNIDNLNDLSKSVVKKYTTSPEDYFEEMGDLILFKPILMPNYSENPFKKDKRTFPIDFKYPRNYAHTVTIEIPEGYVFDEVPKNLRIATPDRALYLNVIYTIEGNKMSMMMKFNIKKTMLLSSRYEEVKTFFDNVVAKENEQIVIRAL